MGHQASRLQVLDCRISTLSGLPDGPLEVEDAALTKCSDATSLLRAHEARVVRIPDDLGDEAERLFSGMAEEIRDLQRLGRVVIPSYTEASIQIKTLRRAAKIYKDGFSYVDRALEHLEGEGFRVRYDVFSVDALEDSFEENGPYWVANLRFYSRSQ